MTNKINAFDDRGLAVIYKRPTTLIVRKDDGSPIREARAQAVKHTTLLLIGGDVCGVAARFKTMLANEHIDDVARWLGISRSVVQRARQAFGLARTYNGTSRTTDWRRAHEKEAS